MRVESSDKRGLMGAMVCIVSAVVFSAGYWVHLVQMQPSVGASETGPRQAAGSISKGHRAAVAGGPHGALWVRLNDAQALKVAGKFDEAGQALRGLLAMGTKALNSEDYDGPMSFSAKVHDELTEVECLQARGEGKNFRSREEASSAIVDAFKKGDVLRASGYASCGFELGPTAADALPIMRPEVLVPILMSRLTKASWERATWKAELSMLQVIDESNVPFEFHLVATDFGWQWVGLTVGERALRELDSAYAFASMKK